MSSTFSSDFGPHTEMTDERNDPRPSVVMTAFRFLYPDDQPSLKLPRQRGATYPFFPAATDSTFSRTPSRPSSFDTLAGTSAYEVSVVSAFVYSRLAVRSNSLRRTGRVAKRPDNVMVVPR